MRSGVQKLLAGLAIAVATFLLGFSLNTAVACHSGADVADPASHSAKTAATAAEFSDVNIERVPLVAAATVRVETPHHQAPNVTPRPDGSHSNAAAQHQQSSLHICPVGKDVCCVNCPKGMTLTALPVRPRDALATVINWPATVLSYSRSLRKLLNPLERSSSGSWPPALEGRASWRSVLLMGSARLRI